MMILNKEYSLQHLKLTLTAKSSKSNLRKFTISNSSVLRKAR
jgi:hypothetical protein